MALTVIIALPFVFAVIVIVVTLPLLDVVTVATFVLLDVAVTVKSPASEGVTVAVIFCVAVPYVRVAVSVEVLPFVKVNEVLLSEIAIGIRYRYVTSPIKEQTSRQLHLLPIELHIGLLSMASKSSVMTTAQPGEYAQRMDVSPNNSEKFHFVVENVKCVASSEMVVQALREVIELVDRAGEVLLKMRMVNTCEKYQTAIVMYTLMGKVSP